MKRIISIAIYIILASQLFAQNVAINNDGSAPNASAMLDIKSTSKGILIPRVNLISDSDEVTVPNPRLSLLIYNSNNALPDGDGYYYWNGNKWTKLATRVNLANLTWNIGGNSNTNANTDFIGTVDNKALVFKTNNILSAKIEPGPNNVFFGQSAGLNMATGNNNSFFGHQAGTSVTFGSDNVFVGHLSGNTTTSGSDNVFIGKASGKGNSIGSRNVFVGKDAGSINTVGNDNTFMGNDAGTETGTGDGNVAIGSGALSANGTGNTNVAIGQSALSNATFASNNIAIGKNALINNTTGNNNIAIGDDAGVLSFVPNLTNTTALGHQAAVVNSNTMAFGNDDVTGWIFGRSNSLVGAALVVGRDNTNGNGAFLTSGGTWTNTSDINRKEDFTEIDPEELLQNIAQLPITRWKYKGTNEYHIGPTAQEFHKLFSLGVDDKTISTVDPAGIALAAIKEQQKIITQQEKQIQQLEKRIEALEIILSR
jgi:hypothetical protein